jgi:hypothetical protein
MINCWTSSAYAFKCASFVFLLFGVLYSVTPPAFAFFGPAVQGDGNVKLMITCEDLIKSRLNNPRSYERVEVVTQGNKAAMTYRASNTFGGIVTQRAVCVNGTQILPVR